MLHSRTNILIHKKGVSNGQLILSVSDVHLVHIKHQVEASHWKHLIYFHTPILIFV